MARVLGQLGRPITQASIAGIAFTLLDLTAGTQVSAGPVPVAGSVYDSLQQQDPRWTKDGPYYPGADGLWGYNWLFVLGAILFAPAPLTAGQPPAPHRLQCEVAFTPVQGEIFRAIYQWTPINAYS